MTRGLATVGERQESTQSQGSSIQAAFAKRAQAKAEQLPLQLEAEGAASSS